MFAHQLGDAVDQLTGDPKLLRHQRGHPAPRQLGLTRRGRSLVDLRRQLGQPGPQHRQRSPRIPRPRLTPSPIDQPPHRQLPPPPQPPPRQLSPPPPNQPPPPRQLPPPQPPPPNQRPPPRQLPPPRQPRSIGPFVVCAATSPVDRACSAGSAGVCKPASAAVPASRSPDCLVGRSTVLCLRASAILGAVLDPRGASFGHHPRPARRALPLQRPRPARRPFPQHHRRPARQPPPPHPPWPAWWHGPLSQHPPRPRHGRPRPPQRRFADSAATSHRSVPRRPPRTRCSRQRLRCGWLRRWLVCGGWCRRRRVRRALVLR